MHSNPTHQSPIFLNTGFPGQELDQSVVAYHFRVIARVVCVQMFQVAAALVVSKVIPEKVLLTNDVRHSNRTTKFLRVSE